MACDLCACVCVCLAESLRAISLLRAILCESRDLGERDRKALQFAFTRTNKTEPNKRVHNIRLPLALRLSHKPKATQLAINDTKCVSLLACCPNRM